MNTDCLLDNYMIDDSDMDQSVFSKKCTTDARVKADRFIPIRQAALIDNGEQKVSELQFEHEASVLRFQTSRK